MDIERRDELVAYLRDTGRIAVDETPEVRVLAGGVSNRTVLVKRGPGGAGGIGCGGEAWVLKQALAKLRTKADWFSDPKRVHREALGLRWLEKLAPPGTITPLVFEDHEHHLLAMQAVPEPHENWKTMLLAGGIEADHVEQFAALLASIHRKSELVEELPQLFDDRSFFESLRLEPYYAYAAEQVPAARDFLHQLIADTRACRTALVHGDYSPKNVLVRDGRLILLDHEVIHWGDPAFDIGFALTHFLSKAHHLPENRERFAAAAMQFCDTYGNCNGAQRGQHTLGCLLARVAGRSPLEYLDDAERRRQQRVVIDLMERSIDNVHDVIEQFVRGIDAHD
ncbi:MAG: phosphotransferase [Tepidisphaeraceae bacterium]